MAARSEKTELPLEPSKLIPVAPAKLRQEMALLASFSMGFADVGADIFLALGLIAAYAGGAMPFAILIAAGVYVLTGLSYAELASSIPVAGGASVYGERAFGRFAGFIGLHNGQPIGPIGVIIKHRGGTLTKGFQGTWTNHQQRQPGWHTNGFLRGC